MDRLPSGSVLMDELLQCDRRVKFDEALTIFSQLPPRSELSGRKAYYSDINAMLLGTIAETLTGKTAAQLLAMIFANRLVLRKRIGRTAAKRSRRFTTASACLPASNIWPANGIRAE